MVVVDLCHTLLRFTKKSAVGQFVLSLDDSKLKSHESDLKNWGDLIRDEVTVLVAHTIEAEAQKNTGFRALWSRKSESASVEQKLRTKLRVLDFCSTYDHETPWKQFRKVGNTTLFERTVDYQEWKRQATSCSILCTGKLGSGKSVLLANIVDDLNLYVHNKGITVAYFFCRHDLPESLDAGTIIRSLVRQLLRPIPDLTIVAEHLEDITSAPDFRRLLVALRSTLPATYQAYIILDGLDECDYDQRKKLILQLRELQDEFKILICVSCRPEPENGRSLSPREFVASRSMSIPEDNPDIGQFIDEELENCIESRNLVIGDPALILDIRDALLQGSQGMFLWVALQITSLCTMKTDNTIREALIGLPKDLPETFARILARSEVAGQPYQRRILELVAIAQRPLQVEELREALSVVPGDTVWNPANLLNDIYSTLACCGSLVTVDEEELTVRLVHHSVKQFILDGFNTQPNFGFTTPDAHRIMAEIIITYLNYGIFDTQLSTIVHPQLMAASAPSRIIHSTLNPSGGVQKLAIKLLRSKTTPNYDISKTIAEARNLVNQKSITQFYFYSYAESWWSQHILCASGLEPIFAKLLLQLLQKRIVGKGSRDIDVQTLFWQACKQAHLAMIELLLALGQIDVNLKNNLGYTPLLLAANNGHEAMGKLLLATGQVDVNLTDDSGYTPLLAAATRGHEALVKLLLATSQVDVNLKNMFGYTPLSAAATNGHEAVVKLLLTTAQVDVNSKDHYGYTPLLAAAMHGHKAVVKLLLATSQVDVNSKHDNGDTPLSLAAFCGHKAVVELLLATGQVDINSKDYKGITPLLLATEQGHKDVVKLLLATGQVDINLKDNRGRTPLSLATEQEHEDVAKLLLDYKDLEGKN